jgi:GT2 family glycosyltransferase
MNSKTIAAVVVTYNRLELLKECIDSLRRQTRKVDNIIVVNNGSTDLTHSWLIKQEDIHLINQDNMGGSGGQHTGIKYAYENKFDWIWCMDDDTIPEQNALEALSKNISFTYENTGFLASLVKWTDGSLHKMNLQWPRNINFYSNIFDSKAIEIEYSSFVSLFLNRNAVNECGFPIKEMFIWYDDIEYTRRISSKFKGYLILDSIVYHKTKENKGVDFSRNAFNSYTKEEYLKYKYGIRNHFYMERLYLLKNKSLTNFVDFFMKILRMLFSLLFSKAPKNLIFKIWEGLVYNPSIDKAK